MTTAEPDARNPEARPGRRNVVALGWVSLLTDVSTEMIVPVLPSFVTGPLHASVTSLGVIEGVAECTATVLRALSGWLSDRIGKRKPFLVLGYGISTVAKGAMAFATSWPAMLGLRFTDRVGKGLRNPPRDALIADSVPASELGSAFGLHRAMDTAGAVIGPLVASLLLATAPGNLRRVFLVSAIPAALSIAVLILFVRAPRVLSRERVTAFHRQFSDLPSTVRRFLGVAVVFSLGASSLAFPLLRAGQAGFGAAQVPLVYALYNVVYAALSWPLGILSDRIGRRPLLHAAYFMFAVCYALLAWRATPAVVLIAFAGLGIHSALLEGSQRTLLAELVPQDRRGTAYGMYATAVGIALLPASVVGGWLWSRFGPSVTFLTGAALALIAAALFATLLPRTERRTA